MNIHRCLVPESTSPAFVCSGNSRWFTALLVLLLGWLCVPSEAQAATRDRKKPTVPTGLTATPAGCGQVNLSWTASTDTGGSGLMGYKVYRNGVVFKTVLAPATETSDVGLASVTRYTYAVLAIDKAGNKSAKTLDVYATTPACCTYSIAPLAASIGADGSSGSIALTTSTTDCNWTASSSAAWLSVSFGSSGAGNGTVGWAAAINASTNGRTGVITIGGQPFTVVQSGATPTVAAVPLGEAVDNATLNLRTGGNANWIGQTTIAYNGGDAAQAGVITNSENSWMETTVTGPADLSFVWKVSSEQNYDFLRFYIDGVDQAGVSGEVGWQPRTFAIGSGTHTVRWAYSKDTIVSAGMDCGWVDQIQVTATIPCSYTVVPANTSFGASGGSSSASVTAPNGCSWTASTLYSWIHTTSSGSGNGTASFTVDANPSTSPRNGSLEIGGQSFTVTQTGATPCSYTVVPANTSFGASGGSSSASVTALNGCSWTASTAYGWIHTTSSGSGNGTASFTVDANPSTSPRNGSLDIAGQSFTVTQAGALVPCAYSISSTGANPGAGAGSGTVNVNVTAGSGCNWTASSSAPNWLTFSPAGGTGNGTVTWFVTANASCNGRSGTLTIAGQQFAVNQAAGSPNFSISPLNTSLPATGGSGSVSVGANSGCGWVAAANDAWISITFGNSGTGSGAVNYSVSANTSTSPRGGSLTIAGQLFTVTQAAAIQPCTYSLSAPSANPGAAGGSGTFNVTAGSTCGWTASSSAPNWLTFSPAGGTGNGTVTWSASVNASCLGRSATLTIAGQVFSVNQGAGSGDYFLSQDSTTVPATGGSGSVGVNANSGCGWLGTANDSWITITSGSAGSGNGSVGYQVSANTSSSPRNGSLTIAGQRFSVSQSGAACTYSLSSGSANPGAAASSGSFNVTAGPTCSWTPLSSAPGWLTFSPAGGVGSGPVTWYATANTSTSPRNGTVNIGGQSFSVTQAGAVVTGGAAQWVKSMLSTPNGYKANGCSVAADASGNVLVAGDFNGTVDFGGGVTVASLSSDDGFVAKYTPQGGLVWSKTYSGTANQNAKSVAVDRQGNVIVVGSFSATVDFGAGPLTAVDPAGLWAPDMFIAKYTPSGALMWAKQFGGTSGDFGNGVAVDGSDNIILIGRFGSQNVNFGGGFTLSSAGGFDIAIVKLSPAGATLWAKRYGGRYDEMPNAVAVDLNGDVAITGQFNNGSGDLGGGAITVPTLYNTIFVAKYSGADGAYRWAKAFGGSSVDGGNGITTDPRNGNIVVTGGFMSTANFDGGNTVNASTRAASGETVFLAGYGSAGNFLWVTDIGGGSGTTDWGNAVRIDANGNLALTGSKGNPWNVGGTWLFNAGFFMMRFTISGDTAPVFQRIQVAESGSTGGSVGCGIAFDPTGQILVTGSFCFGTVNFGGVSATTLPSSYSGFVTKYSN